MSEVQHDNSEQHGHGGYQAVACDGGGGPLGHPKVYLELHDGKAVCPYCSKEFNADETAEN